jgi:competence protein ComEA
MRFDRVIVVLLAVLLLASLYFRSRPARHEPVQAASSVPASPTGYIKISGDVRHPGIYELSANKMAVDAIKMADPVVTPAADDLATFAALSVVSGEALVVRIQPGGKLSLTRGTIPVSERLVMKIPLDINTMNEADFDRVPGIGPAMAKRIVAYRQNNGGSMSKRDLLSIEGIGEKKYSVLSKYFN